MAMSYTSFVYEIQTPNGGPPERGEFEARDESVARRRLRGMLGELRLPPNARLYVKSEIERRRADAHSAKLRHLLRVLGEHHAWLDGKGAGRRADLTRLDLSGVSLRGKSLKYADMAEVDLSGADLAGADLSGANLVRANLNGADLRNVNLTGADLSDADLRGARLAGATLDGVELWRANLRGCVIAPKALHAALECTTK